MENNSDSGSCTRNLLSTLVINIYFLIYAHNLNLMTSSKRKGKGKKEGGGGGLSLKLYPHPQMNQLENEIDRYIAEDLPYSQTKSKEQYI